MNHLMPSDGKDWDPACFIQLTDISPATVVTASWIIFALLFGIAAACTIMLARPPWVTAKESVLKFASNNK
jgi:hypothetical protein